MCRMNIKKPTLNIIDRKEFNKCPENGTANQQEFRNFKKNSFGVGESAIIKSLLANLNLHIAVINAEGILISVNKAADNLTKTAGPMHLSDCLIGCNYFKECKEATTCGENIVEKILENISAVLNKQITNFSSEYSIDSFEQKNTFLINAFRSEEDDSQVIVTHQFLPQKNKDQDLSIDGSSEIKKTLSEFNALLNSSLDVICTLNRTGNFVTINQASQELLGYAPSEILHTNFLNLVYSEDIVETAKTFEQIINGTHIPVYENRSVHKNGKIVPFLWSINYDTELDLVFCVGKDIADRKRLEQAIQNERDQFYHIFLSASSAICILKGPNHIYEMANTLYLKLINKKDIVGKPVIEVLPEISEQGFIKILDQVYKTGESRTNSMAFIQLKDETTGEYRDHFIDIVHQAYRNTAGEIDGVFLFMNDITMQVESNKKIEKSEKQYRQILETAQEGIWVIDENSNTTFVNKKICELFGYSEHEIMGKKNSHFMDEDSKKKALLAQNRRKQGVSEKLELKFISKKGEEILTNVSATPIFDDNLNFMGSLGMVSNISEKRHLENLLEKSNRLARIGSWEIDVVQGTVFWSDITKEIREVPTDFIPDLKTGIDFFTEGIDKTIISDRLQRCIESGTPWDEELQLRTFKGNLKWVRTIGEAIFINGKCCKIYGSFQDITEKKNAAEKVLRSETRLNIAQLIAQVGSWEINVKTNDQSWSAEFCRILEIDESITPSYEAFLPFVHPDDRAHAIRTMANSFPKQLDSSFQFRFKRKNGDIGYASSEWTFEFDNYGNPLYIYGILRDLTNEKKAEIERVKMISDITQRNKDLEQFSYIISHNLRAPVANIIGLTEELKDETHDAEAKLMLSEALSSDVKRLENVIVDLNTILQTKREINELKETVNLTQLVHNIKLSINDLIQKRGVHIKTDFTQIEEIHIIKSYIYSIFYNLISNSIKYRRSDCDAIIEIKSYIIDDKLSLKFTDNGRGIDLESKGDQIFGLYKRFHSDTEGKGMGLYMVKTQLEALGGKISAVSEVNIGSTFTLEFENSPYI